MAFSRPALRFEFLTDGEYAEVVNSFAKKKEKAATSDSRKSETSAKKSKPKHANTSTSIKDVPGSSQQLVEGKQIRSPTNQNIAPGSPEKESSSDKQLGNHEGFPKIESSPMACSSDKHEIPSEGNNVPTKKESKKKKKAPTADKLKKDRLKESQNADEQFVSGSFVSSLKSALFQTEIDNQGDAEKAFTFLVERTNKNKPFLLAEFDLMFDGSNFQPDRSGNASGFSRPASGSNAVRTKQFLVKETKVKLEEESSHEPEDQENLLKPQSLVAAPEKTNKRKKRRQKGKKEEPLDSNTQTSAISCSDPDHLTQSKLLLEKQDSIDTILKENCDLEKELNDLRVKFRKVFSIFADDAELKEKVILLRDTEKLTELSIDLNEQVSLLRSQLEQEKSECNSVATQLLEANEQMRKKTQSHTKKQ